MADNLNAADLSAVDVDGLINEEVMQRIWDISRIPLPLTDMIGSGSIGNARFSWTLDALQDPLIDDQVVDGSDTITNDDTNLGARVQNYAEIKTRTVKVSSRADASNTIGFARALAYQVMMRQLEVRRSVEATMLSNNASQADDGASVPGVTGGLDAWLVTNTIEGATGSVGGFNTVTGVVDAYTPGTPAALTETVFKDMLQAVYEQGGEAITVMARTPVIRLFSEFQFSAGARVATLTRETKGDAGPATAVGAVNVYIGDFATVTLRANRLQQVTASNSSTMFILDPDLLEVAFLRGYRTETLQKAGLAENRQLSVDWGLRVGNEAGLAAIRDIDETAAMVVV
ncbi:MAG: DUF5309 family protein [Pseudomonadales bacterium]